MEYEYDILRHQPKVEAAQENDQKTKEYWQKNAVDSDDQTSRESEGEPNDNIKTMLTK